MGLGSLGYSGLLGSGVQGSVEFGWFLDRGSVGSMCGRRWHLINLHIVCANSLNPLQEPSPALPRNPVASILSC